MSHCTMGATLTPISNESHDLGLSGHLHFLALGFLACKIPSADTGTLATCQGLHRCTA